MTRSLVEAVTAIKLCPGISLAGVPLDFADVCCNDQNEVRLMCSYQEPVMGDDALAGAHVLAQLRAQSRPELRTEETRATVRTPSAIASAVARCWARRAASAERAVSSW